MKLLTRIADPVMEDADASINKQMAVALTLTIEQLQCKQTILDDFDAKIAPLIDNKMDLESEITEAEDTRMKIFEGIAHLKLSLSSCPQNTASAKKF